MIYIGPARDGSMREELKIDGKYELIAVQLMHIFMMLLEEGGVRDVELFAMVQAACDTVEERRKKTC